MSLEIFVVVVVISFIQSIFGVGVLLFGTPILLALGHDFIATITILLPISCTISIFQIIRGLKEINLNILKNILLFTIPFVVLFLLIITSININVGFIVGIFLIIVGLKDYSMKIENIIKTLVMHEKSYLITMGIIHGMTNLGGSLLTAFIHSKNYAKNIARSTIAASYLTFAVFQIATLILSKKISYQIIWEDIPYLISGAMIFVLTEIIVYKKIDNHKYAKYFAVFLFISGIFLCIKSIIY